MDYSYTPQSFNGSSIKRAIASPTTASSKKTSGFRSPSSIFEGVRQEINDIIQEASEKKNMNNRAVENIYRANQDILAELDPQRNLRLENQELRRELNEALRQILRLNKIIAHLDAENQCLKSKLGYRTHNPEDDLLRDFEQLKAEGEQLRLNVIRLLRKK